MRPLTSKLLIVLACTILLALFFVSFEKVQRTEFVGFTGEARYNDFLTAQLFLEEAGIEADSVQSLTPTNWLPDFEDTVFSRTSDAMSTPEEQSALLAWVSEGGHLVLLPPGRESELTDQLLSTIGAQFVEVDEETLEEAAEESSDETTDSFGEDETFAYILNLQYMPFRIETTVDDVFEATLSDDVGLVAARREWGNGYITIIADDAMFSHESLADYDHARFLLDVVAGFLSSGKVWFIQDATFASLAELIWKNASLLVLAAAVAIFLWLWSVIPRFGPSIDARSLERRSLLEHVAAAGHFAWKHRGTAALAQSSAKALIHEADKKHPGVSRLSPERQAKHISHFSGAAPQKILDVLVAREEPRHRQFTRKIQFLQRLRKKL